MNEPPIDPPVYLRPVAVRFGFAVLVVFTLILGLAFSDQAHRRELETVSETTAVGDTRYLPQERVAALQLRQFEIRDSHVTKTGEDASTGLPIYALSPAATVAERKHFSEQAAGVLLKTGVNQWVVAPAGKLHTCKKVDRKTLSEDADPQMTQRNADACFPEICVHLRNLRIPSISTLS